MPRLPSKRRRGGGVARETLVLLTPDSQAAIEAQIRQVYGIRTRLRESLFVKERDEKKARRALVHVFDAMGRDRGTCFAWFAELCAGGRELVLVLQTEAVPTPEAALRAFRRPEA
jgi:hypothetical protein